MTEQITLNVTRHAGEYGSVVTIGMLDSVLQNMKGRIMESVMLEIRNQIVAVWMEKHSAALLEELAPNVMADEIKKALNTKIATLLLGDRKA